MDKKRLRNWCFTAYVDELKIEPNPVIRYYVYQKEKCPSTGTLHWQGYIEFNKAMRYGQIAKAIGTHRAKFFEREGTPEQAANYCKKSNTSIPNTLVEWGEMSKPGCRMDIHEAVDAIRNGIENNDTDYYLFRYPQGYRALKAKYNVPVNRPNIKIIYIYGEPGCGKSEMADELAPDAYRMEDDKTLWMDNYTGQKDIIIDDFKGNLPITKILRLCDKYKLQLPYKGGFVPIKADRIIFTSNFHPMQVYENDSQQDAWLDRFRRFGEIKFQQKDPNYVKKV